MQEALPTAADRIRLTGIAATGRHGVFEHERREGQRFVADVVLHVDTRPAAAEDRLDRTVHYGVLAEQVAHVLSGQPADLIETVAERIAAVALAHDGVAAVEVTVHKPQAPITVPFSDVTVEIRRDRARMPVVAAPDVAGPDMAEADVTEPDVTEPDVTEPDVAEPDVAEPDITGPHATEPHAGGPDATGPADGAPALGDTTVADLVVPGLVPEPVGRPPDLLAPGVAGEAAPQEDLRDLVVDGLVTTDAPTEAAGDRPVHPGGDRLDAAPPRPVEVVLALGSNLGSSQETLRRVIRDLDAVDGLRVTAVSPLARTAPVGGPAQEDYLNAVVLGTTSLSPRALLRACQSVEAAHGRQRLERWGPRTVDIDIVVHGSTVAAADDLELPHPRAHQRAFVLQPWAQVDPDAVLPGLGGGPVAALAGTAPDRHGIRWMALDWWTGPEGDR